MYLVFDIGGTKTRLGISHDGVHLDRVSIVHTPFEFPDLLTLFAATFQELTAGEPVTAAAGGVAGTLSLAKDTWVQAYKHPHWVGEPLQQELESIIDAPAHLENDAAMAGLGEAVYGAGRDYRIVAFLTVSTGFGGARIVDKRLDAKLWGFEPGKQIINIDLINPLRTPLRADHVERFVSGKAVADSYHQKPEDIHDPHVWDQITNILAMGVNNVIAFWSPEVIVFGGSMMKSIDLAAVEEYLSEYVHFIPQLPALRHIELPEHSGLYGCLAYLKSL